MVYSGAIFGSLFFLSSPFPGSQIGFVLPSCLLLVLSVSKTKNFVHLCHLDVPTKITSLGVCQLAPPVLIF